MVHVGYQYAMCFANMLVLKLSYVTPIAAIRPSVVLRCEFAMQFKT